MELERGAAPDIHRIEDASVNWYLVEAESGLTIVDAGVPSSWDSLVRVLGEIGREAREIRALVLTHAHFDHIGFAERARRQLGVPVHVHENDMPLARKPLQYTHGRARTRYLLTVGHCALYFPDRDAVLVGDAIVMLDPYTGARGPRIVAGAATADSGWALRSLDALAAVDAGIVLTGHGEPWRGGSAEAVRLARAAGVS